MSKPVDALRELVAKEAAAQSTPSLAIGFVTSASPLQVTFFGDGTSTTISLRLSSYTPNQGDKVLLARVGQGWIVVGKVQ